MTKRAISVSLILVILTGWSFRARAASVCQLNDLQNCRRIFAYSGNTFAFFYGFYGSTVVSSRVIPDQLTRRAEVAGNILCVSQNDNSVCALYKAGIDAYKALTLRMDSGVCDDREVAKGFALQPSSVAAADDEVFVIAVENGRSYVRGCLRDREYSYRFSQNIDKLFVFENAAHARLDGGAVYRLGGGASALCEGASEPVSAFSADGTMTAAANGQEAVLRRDFSCTVTGGEYSGENAAEPVTAVAAGLTVAKIKRERSDIIAVLNGSGSEVESGALKTGYILRLTGGESLLAVLGDPDGSGTVSGRDTDMLMRYLTDSVGFSSCESRAADFNGDGCVDNRDLILIACAAKE